MNRRMLVIASFSLVVAALIAAGTPPAPPPMTTKSRISDVIPTHLLCAISALDSDHHFSMEGQHGGVDAYTPLRMSDISVTGVHCFSA